MEPVLIVIFIVIFIYILWKYLLKKKIIKKKVENFLKKYPNFSSVKNQSYDFVLENEKMKLCIKLVIIPMNSMITINNLSTWKLSWGGSLTNPGKAYPHHKYLTAVTPFLEESILASKKVRKVVLLWPKTQIIVKHINECKHSDN